MELRHIGENGIIGKFKSSASNTHPDIAAGIGEDCAVINIDGSTQMLVTTDMLIEGTHFRLDTVTPYQLGRKALSVNLSDIAAMGGKPAHAFLSLGFPHGVTVEFLDEFIAGFDSVARRYGVSLVGGDTVSSPHGLVINVIVLGMAETGKVICRSGARAGDTVYVTGFLGDAAAGLEILRRDIDVPADIKDYLLKAHLDPMPQLEIGFALAQSGIIHAMIDVSDGMASDLWHICDESKVGAKIFKERIPISEPCRELAHILKTSPLEWALSGGEDYTLLFTTSGRYRKRLQHLIERELGHMVFEVGEIVEGKSVWLVNGRKRKDVSGKGYNHFRTE